MHLSNEEKSIKKLCHHFILLLLQLLINKINIAYANLLLTSLRAWTAGSTALGWPLKFGSSSEKYWPASPMYTMFPFFAVLETDFC